MNLQLSSTDLRICRWDGHGTKCSVPEGDIMIVAEALLTPEAPVTEDRVRYGPGGGVYKIVATAAETQNQIFAFEATEPPGGGPPLHTHANEEEFFLVLEGEMSFYVGGQVITKGPGGTAFVPRGTPHCFKNCSNAISRVLVLFTPGNIEGFFEYGALIDGKIPNDEQLIAKLQLLGPRYGLEMLGPSPL